MLLAEPICRTISLTVYSRVIISVGVCLPIFVFILLFAALLLSLTFLQPGCVVVLLMFEFAMCKSCVTRLIEKVQRTLYSSITRERDLTAIIRNRPRHYCINLLYAAVPMSPTMPDFTLNKGGRPVDATPCGRKVGDSHTGSSYFYLSYFCFSADECPLKYVRLGCSLQVVAAMFALILCRERRLVRDCWYKVLAVPEVAEPARGCTALCWWIGAS